MPCCASTSIILKGGSDGVPPSVGNPFSTNTATRGGAVMDELVSGVFVVWENPVKPGQRKTTNATRSNRTVWVISCLLSFGNEMTIFAMP